MPGGGTLDRLPDLSTIFISIMLQSLPFILVGVFASAVAEVYLSERIVGRWLPRGRLSSVLLASLFGVVAPVCDCGVIPLARRLVGKGVPVYAAVTFILAAPVVNPVVALSTAVAFGGDWRVVATRLAMSASVAIAVGLLASVLFPARGGLLARLRPVAGGSDAAAAVAPPGSAIERLVRQANAEFFDVIFYIALGALFAAATQVYVPRNLLNSVGGEVTLSVLVMMPLATVLSLCSEADAFVARAFANSFTLGSIFAFMVIGQIVDLRNGVLLFRTLRAGYVALIVVVSYLMVFVEALIVNAVAPRW